MTARASTGISKLDEMLGGGLWPGTLCVVYGATGIGKGMAAHIHKAKPGLAAEEAPGIFFDMNARGDSQQHFEYAERLYEWKLRRWTHTVTPMSEPFPSADQMTARYCDALPWVGKLRDYQVPTPDGSLELDWNWKAEYNHALYTVRPFVYFHLGAGCRRVVVDGVEPMDVPGDFIQPFLFDELYGKTIHRDSETLGMEICLPVWKYREFIDSHRYDHATVTTMLLVTTEETQLEHLIARKVASGDIGAVANTIIVMGSERVGNRLGRFLCVVKHRGSAKSDEIAEYRVTERGLEFV